MSMKLYNFRFNFGLRSERYISCGTVALMVLGQFSDICRPWATDFTLSKTFETAQWKCCATFLQIFVMKSGARTIKHIFRFVKYLSTFFYTYLPVDIHYHNKCLDINWSRLLRSAILSLWYSRFEVTWLLRDHFNSKTCVRFVYMKNLKMLNESSPELE